MAHTSTALAFLFTHGAQRLAQAAPLPGFRSFLAHAASLSVAVGLRPGMEAGLERVRDGRLLRIRRAIGDFVALARTDDSRPPAADPGSEADLVEAKLLAEQWRSRAEAGQRRIAELEERLATSEMTALELRSRVVCLQGKLATSTATARYQTLTMALELEHQGQATTIGSPSVHS